MANPAPGVPPEFDLVSIVGPMFGDLTSMVTGSYIPAAAGLYVSALVFRMGLRRLTRIVKGTL